MENTHTPAPQSFGAYAEAEIRDVLTPTFSSFLPAIFGAYLAANLFIWPAHSSI